MQDDVSRLRHSIRGCLNAMMLGVSALELDLTPEESVEFLTDIASAADQMASMFDEYELLVDETGLALKRG